MASHHGCDAGEGMMHAHRATPLRNAKRGTSIFGDLTWILVFCICALILFLFLYKPLVEKQVEQKSGTTIAGLNIEPIYSDAEYIAIGLREQRPAGTTSGGAGSFVDSARDLVERRANTSSDSAFKKAVEQSAYTATLDATFAKGSPFWTDATYTRSTGEQVHERQAVAVVLHWDKGWIPETCRAYTPDGTSDTELCTNSAITWSDSKTTIDPDTQIAIPEFGVPVEPGSIYLPTAQGGATLYVFVQRSRK